MATKKLANNDIAGTIQIYENAIAQNSKENCVAYFLLGNILLTTGKISEAIKHYKNYFNHDCKKANISEVLMREIRAHIRLGHLDVATDILNTNKAHFTAKKFTELSTELTALHNDMNLLDIQIEKKHWKHALELNEKLRRELTHSNRLLKYKFQCFEALNDVNGLVSALRVYILMNPDDVDVMLKLSQSYFTQCNFVDSLDFVRRCLKSDQGNPNCMKHLRNVRMVKKTVDGLEGDLNVKNYNKVVKAIPELQKIHKDSNNMECLLSKSLYLECVARSHLKKNSDDVVKLCTNALENFVGDVKMKAQLYLRRSVTYIDLDKLDEAKKDIHDSITLDSTNEAEEVKQKIERLIKNRDKKDYYRILEVPRNANEKQISSAYRKKALLYHPDKAKNEEERVEFEKKFMDINSAREVLLDREKREMFDQGRDPFESPQQQHHQSPFGHPFGGGGGSFFQADHGFFNGGHFRFHF